VPGRDEYNPEDTGPVGGRRRELPAVPPARPRATPSGAQPTYHPTTELDLSRGFPPPVVSNETSEIDLSGGWPEHLKVPPRRASWGAGRPDLEG
jgi:putative Holliday junction resolvase